MEYIIIEEDTIAKLVIQVNQKINEGFEPVGGVCIGTHEWFLQSMVKRN